MYMHMVVSIYLQELVATHTNANETTNRQEHGAHKAYQEPIVSRTLVMRT